MSISYRRQIFQPKPKPQIQLMLMSSVILTLLSQREGRISLLGESLPLLCLLRWSQVRSGKNNFCAWHGLFSSGLKYWLWMRYVSCRLEANKSINLNLLDAQQATARYEVGHEYNHHGFDRNLALTMQLMNSLGKRSGSESSLPSV